LAGFAQNHYVSADAMVRGGRVQTRYDFVGGDDLAALANLDLLQAYSEWRREGGDELEGESVNGLDAVVAPSIANLALELGRLASPYLEARALQEARRREAVGDAEGARAAHAAARELRHQGERLTKWGFEHTTFGNSVKDIQAIADAWTGANNREGWLKLGDLAEILLQKAVQVTNMSLEQQLETIRAAADPSLAEGDRQSLLQWQSAKWAGLLRGAMLVNVARKIPMRARAASEFRLDWWKTTGPQGEPVALWDSEAAIMVTVPAWAMKSSRDYTVPYVRPEHVGNPEFEHGTYRTLVELYLRPHGARDMVNTIMSDSVEGPETSREVVPSPYLFPPFAWSQPRSVGPARWSPAALSSHFEELVRQHADALAIDVTRLQALHGGLRFHAIRLLFGTYWAPRRLTDAALMLHHANTETTSRLYCGKGSYRVTLEATREERSRDHLPRTRAELENAELQEKLAAAEARCRDLEAQVATAEARATSASPTVRPDTSPMRAPPQRAA
jgi:hypothetical protein